MHTVRVGIRDKAKSTAGSAGREPKVGFIFQPRAYASTIQDELRKAYSRVSEIRDLKMDKAKLRYDRQVRAASFKLTDLVLLLDTAMKKGVCKKLSKKYRGPYKIIAKLEECVYIIKPVANKGRKITVHQNRLKRCFERKIVQVVQEDILDAMDQTHSKGTRIEVGAATRVKTSQQEENGQDKAERNDGKAQENKQQKSDRSFVLTKYLKKKIDAEPVKQVERPKRNRKRPDFLTYN